MEITSNKNHKAPSVPLSFGPQPKANTVRVWSLLSYPINPCGLDSCQGGVFPLSLYPLPTIHYSLFLHTFPQSHQILSIPVFPEPRRANPLKSFDFRTSHPYPHLPILDCSLSASDSLPYGLPTSFLRSRRSCVRRLFSWFYIRVSTFDLRHWTV